MQINTDQLRCFSITDFPGSCALSEIEVSIVSFFPQPLMYQMAWLDLTHLPGHHCFPQQSKPSGHGRRVHVNPERPAGHERASDPSLKNGNGFPKSWFHVGHDDDVLEIKITFGHWGDNFMSLLHQSDTTQKKNDVHHLGCVYIRNPNEPHLEVPHLWISR